jgi:hypothetical protein
MLELSTYDGPTNMSRGLVTKSGTPVQRASVCFIAGLILGVLVLSCTPAGDGNAASIPRPPPASIAEDASISLPDAAADADNSAGASYRRREWVITRGNGTLVFEAPGEGGCKPLPDKRPRDFTMILQQRRGEPGDWTYYGLSETAPCHFAWSMSWMDPPPGACQTIEGAAFDRLYEELRALSPHTIRSRQMTEYVSPHRGGWAIHLRWANVECEVSDILDSEVDARDRPRFDAVQNLVRKAYQAP